MPVVWRAQALADVVRIIRFVAAENPIAARRIGHSLLMAGDSLTSMPLRGRNGTVPGTRELAIVEPYVIVYRADGEAVVILRVWHGAQQRGA